MYKDEKNCLLFSRLTKTDQKNELVQYLNSKSVSYDADCQRHLNTRKNPDFRTDKCPNFFPVFKSYLNT